MRRKKHFQRRFWGTFLFAVAAIFLFTGCERPDDETEEPYSSDDGPGYGIVFDPSVVKRIDLVFAPEDWQALLDDMTELLGPFGQMLNPPPDAFQEMFNACNGLKVGDPCSFTVINITREGSCIENENAQNGLLCSSDKDQTDMLTRDPIYKPCTVKFGGRTWQHVGMRFKGNSSLFSTWGSGSYKLPFRLYFDKFEDDFPEIENQRFYGFNKLTFASGFGDNSLIREQIAADIFRDAGVPAAKTVFYRIYIDHGEGPIYFGLYTMIEDPNGPMLNNQFSDDDGNLYKPEKDGATFATFNEESFVKKTNNKEADWSDVKAVYDALHADRTNAAAWRSDLESVFDADGFLQYLAANNFVMNYDAYGRYPHNYYLYSDSDVINWIPWDHSMAFNNIPSEEPPDLSHVTEEFPLIRYLLDDPVYFSRYIFFVHETLAGVFAEDRMTDRFQSAFNLIKPYVVGTSGETKPYTLLRRPAKFRNSLRPILNVAEKRRTDSEKLLSDVGYSPSTVVISEIYYHPPEEQGDDYEFIELTNIGDNAVDLSSYKFSGIDFTFPTGISIAPGEYLLVCKNAEMYADKATQLFQWDAGKLSDKGERLALLDPNENFVDYVKYNDGFNWPAKADGDGYSLELGDSASVNSMAENWQAVTLSGTPGSGK